jgi:ABC-type branched-subunit amino acid transport system substrate-binding protein
MQRAISPGTARASLWNPKQPDARHLAKRVAQEHVDVVYLCGLIDAGAAAVLAALRQALPARTPLVACSGVLPSSLLFEQAGEPARGTYVTVAGLVPERLPAPGRRFVREFGATQAGRPVDMQTVYAAQAAEVLLAAIGRSDGTRASVSRQLLHTRARDTLVGPLSIDGFGDPVPTPVTVLRLDRAGRSNAILSYEGAHVDRVIQPALRLRGP